MSEMWAGSDFDVLTQKQIAVDLDWINKQPGLLAHGRAICVFDQALNPEFMELLLKKYYRILPFFPSSQEHKWQPHLERTGNSVHSYLLLRSGEENLNTCRALAIPAAQFLPGYTITELNSSASDDLITQVQRLYAIGKVIPQPGYFLKNECGDVHAVALIDSDEKVVGTTLYHHLRRLKGAYEFVAYAGNTVIDPTFYRKYVSQLTRNRSSTVRPSIAAWLNAHVALACREKYGLREVWSNARPDNSRSTRFQSSLGASCHPSISFSCCERALPGQVAPSIHRRQEREQAS